jgi:hypothetical protein
LEQSDTCLRAARNAFAHLLATLCLTLCRAISERTLNARVLTQLKARRVGVAHTAPMPTPSSSSAERNTSFRSLVLPREHGSWSLALEPVALGLLVAPSRAGMWLALAVLAGFFTRRPLKLALTLPGTDARRPAAWRWVLALSTLAIAALLLAGTTNASQAHDLHSPKLLNKQNVSSSDFVTVSFPEDATGDSPNLILLNKQFWPRTHSLWPLLLALPCGVLFLWFDLRGEMREAEAELAGSTAFALVPAAFATLAGWNAAAAVGLAALMLARSIPTVLTVRTYVRSAKGKSTSAGPALLCAIASLLGVAALAIFHQIPVLACGFVALLVLRSTLFLSPLAPTWSAKRVGLLEAILGLTYLAGLTAAYALR